jgi:hypothetical protein
MSRPAGTSLVDFDVGAEPGEETSMPPRGVKRPKRKRQYKKVLSSIKKEGRYKGRQKEVAARIVNKTKRRKAETGTKARKAA